MLSALLYLVTLPPAPAMSADEIVRRAVAMMDRQPERTVCQVRMESQILDGGGKLKETRSAQIEETRTGRSVKWHVLRLWKNGKEMGEKDRQAQERQHQPLQGSPFVWPFSQEGPKHYRYSLLRQERLWGRPAYVVQVRAASPGKGVGEGVAWLDAESFVQLRGDFAPLRPPDRIDWVKVQQQYSLHPRGFVVPSFLKLEGAGHWLFIRKGFRITLTADRCS